MHAKGLADDAPDAVAADGAAGDPHRYRKAQARRARIVHARSHGKESITHASPARMGGIKVALAPQAKSRRQSEPPWHRALEENFRMGAL
jgi:hypothetical protein